MKKTLIILAVIALMAGLFFFGCQSSAEKAKDAEEIAQKAEDEAIEANYELDEARHDSYLDYLEFKKESEEIIASHKKSIAKLRVRIKSEKKENRAIHEKKLNEIEQKSSEMKKKMDEYKEDGIDKWTKFKKEFNHDMVELGNALEDFTTKNV